jgi:hypothetical protein
MLIKPDAFSNYNINPIAIKSNQLYSYELVVIFFVRKFT